MELFKATTRLDATLVHYKGGGPALNDLIGGHVNAIIASAELVLPHVRIWIRNESAKEGKVIRQHAITAQ